MRRPDVPEVATKTTKDLLRSVFRMDGVDDASAQGESRKEIERRIDVIFKGDHLLKDWTFEFKRFFSYTSAGIFTVEVLVGGADGWSERFLQGALENLHPVINMVSLIGGKRYMVTFDIARFEDRLVRDEEPAGVYVDESPLTFGQITRQRLRWANLQFDKAVQPHIGGFSTAFKAADGFGEELRIHAETAGKQGDDLLSEYVLRNKPLGFYIQYGEVSPARGVYLHISFADFKKLLPSGVVEEGVAEVAGGVGGVVGGKVGS